MLHPAAKFLRRAPELHRTPNLPASSLRRAVDEWALVADSRMAFDFNGPKHPRLSSPGRSSNSPGWKGFNALCSSWKKSAFVFPLSGEPLTTS